MARCHLPKTSYSDLCHDLVLGQIWHWSSTALRNEKTAEGWTLVSFKSSTNSSTALLLEDASQVAFRMVWERGSPCNLGTPRVKIRTAAAGAGNEKEGARPMARFHPAQVRGQILSVILCGWGMAFQAATMAKHLCGLVPSGWQQIQRKRPAKATWKGTPRALWSY